MTQSLNDESKRHIEQVAGEALAQLESIAEASKSKLLDGRTLGSDALASINTMTSSSAIQHIKGLEFEAVFFIGIDQLAELHPALFDKYLYVGTTRAATYLGVTCEGSLPSAIESLRAHFRQDWQ